MEQFESYIDSLWDRAKEAFGIFIDYETLQNQSDLANLNNSQQQAVDYAAAQQQQNQQMVTYVLIGGAVLAAVLLLRK